MNLQVITKLSALTIRVARLQRQPLRLLTRKSTIMEEFEDFEKSPEDAPNEFGFGDKRRMDAHSFLLSKVAAGKLYSSHEWDEILSNALEMPKWSVNNINISGIVMSHCLTENNYNLALCFLKYLEENDKEINNGTISVFLRLCHSTWPEPSEEVIFKYYDLLKNRIPFFIGTLAENCILALSWTSRWRECFELVEFVRSSGIMGIHIYTILITTAFRNKDPKLGWDFLNKAGVEGKHVRAETFSTWLQYCAENEPTLAGAESILNYFYEINYPVNEVIAEDVKQYFECVVKPAWKVESTAVRPNGMCVACRKKLPSIHISLEEFNILSAHFFEKNLLGKDVFSKSSPGEIERFSAFLKQSRPYDVVIDGLNAAFCAGVRNAIPPIDLLTDVVEYFLARDMKILVIGRAHMLKWNRRKMDYIQRNSKVFLTENLSQDDPFVLYAAMSGGPDTYFVSRDMMRGHKHKLNDVEMERLFKRWQLARQYSVFGLVSRAKALIYPPSSFLPFSQKTGDSWHVPYVEGTNEYMNQVFKPPKTWLCIRK
ncbi:mitochondrial ribonuclease P catalytic subunit [Neocloeon triangulifer]|uniref:mitochondrial ribonuclease P catalytic subunit n=1 Tax=Neocloeon triangulifer TaxID=2078957 RepID=UPI00286F8C44|nr:mitochondrial ribonuclease P catalytic subunit [Neocloeon triangulifer]XP_059480928.1 mitochondrial ribonuclease P catalytic subunit [Neocloeon triangulifer]XP_059480929.1 mitochondrial ribonuclease P catalytic subunit [Neocloeon triangulifer]XP_059480930.1 mitochondrial ribonuclease P catalytic subunit [Neocloeon triangulifer]XP_059480931.1 mitochondrial ribonuclease P catalytic subunit [Neocloeon triangulifer]